LRRCLRLADGWHTAAGNKAVAHRRGAPRRFWAG